MLPFYQGTAAANELSGDVACGCGDNTQLAPVGSVFSNALFRAVLLAFTPLALLDVAMGGAFASAILAEEAQW